MNSEERQTAIARVSALPAQVSDLVEGLSAEQLTTAYDKGEWTIAAECPSPVRFAYEQLCALQAHGDGRAAVAQAV